MQPNNGRAYVGEIMDETAEDVWSSRRSESPVETMLAGSELSAIFDAVDSLYVDGSIRLPKVRQRSSLSGDNQRTMPFPLSHAVTAIFLLRLITFIRCVRPSCWPTHCMLTRRSPLLEAVLKDRLTLSGSSNLTNGANALPATYWLAVLTTGTRTRWPAVLMNHRLPLETSGSRN